MAEESQELVAKICHKLHEKEEALIPGTGVALKQGDLVFIPPADVHLDRLEAEDVFTFNSGFDSSGNAELNSEATNPCHNISAYTNLFLRIFNEFDCGCVFYAQPKSAVVICELFDKFYKIKNNQLITQISNGETKEQYPSTHELAIPIIANPNDQSSLFKVLEKAFGKNPQTNAVLIKGNGLFVCGDTWQETKLMYETLLHLFETSIELHKVGKINNAKVVATKPDKKDVEIIETKKAPVTKVATKVRNPVKYPEGNKRKEFSSTSKTFRDNLGTREELALRRKKLALARLRMNNSGAREGIPSRRMNAASFMQRNVGNSNMDNNYMQNMNMANNGGMNIGNGSNMNMNGMNMNGMGMNEMNMNMNMDMHQGNNMMMNNQMAMSNNGMMNMGMNQTNQNMNMNNDMFNNGMGNDGFMSNMNMNNGMNNGMMEQRSSGMYQELAMEQAYSGRKKSFSPRRGRGRGVRGNVKERLGFKSNISVDPSKLSKVEVNTEDY